MKQVVHIPVSNPESGSDVTLRDQQARRWHERGFAVAPVPADGLFHPFIPKVCPHCKVVTYTVEES